MSEHTIAKKRKKNNQPESGNQLGLHYTYAILGTSILTRLLSEHFELGPLQELLNFSPQEFRVFTLVASAVIFSFSIIGTILAIRNKKVSLFLWGLKGSLSAILCLLVFKLGVVIYHLLFLH